MQIRELFEKDVARPIEGVIKADDKRQLETELDEYVVTRDVLRGLSALTDRYLNEGSANGVWISGFFGSGKSHLLKILSLVLDRRPLDSGRRPADIILGKIEDEMVRADLRKAANIPAQSILFNVDQKFDGIGGDHSAPILEVFVKVMNELQGYFGNQGYIAQFEHQLAQRSEFDGFKQTYLRVNGRTWEDDRGAVATVNRRAFALGYAAHFGVGEDEGLRLMREVRSDYRMSIESFAQRVKEYIDSQGPGFRLNFFVDEIGQFIGQDGQRMLNLQTVAETLSTVCGGRAWVFVTSQADLEKILGEFKGMEAQDITKIKGRFKTQLTLASADVQEVIQKRLLAKREREPQVLTDIYDREKDNLATLFRFTDGSLQLKSWRGSDEFCALYPFNPYQMSLFQTAIMTLSAHDAFTGRYLSVGERSMLAVFQDVAKAVREKSVGTLASFDLMQDGLAPSLRGDVQTSLKLAEQQLEQLPVRILKALFLLKYVPAFKATVRNVAILLIDRPDVDIAAHEKAVGAGLAVLESQSYLQRNAEVYEFLTDKEKDIEKEIKAVDIDESEVMAELNKQLFSDILRDPKIRYEANGQDYTYVRRIDDALVGRQDGEIGVNIITTENPNYANAGVLAAQNSGKAELLMVLPANEALVAEVRLYLKTQKFIAQNSGTSDTNRKAILERRSDQNGIRRSSISVLASQLLTAAPVYLNGSLVENLGASDARTRFAKAGQALVAFAYPSLRMLVGTYNEAVLVKTLTDQDDLLAGGEQPLSEAENEVLMYVVRNKDNGDRTTADEICKHFGKRPYGWVPMGTLTLTARLFRMGRLELRTTDLLTAREAVDQLRNSRSWPGVRVTPQAQIPAATIAALKAFHKEFFDKTNTGGDARAVAQQTLSEFKTEAVMLSGLAHQANNYPFVGVLAPFADRLQRLATNDYAYVLNQLEDFKDELLDAKEETIAPIKAFMNGPQKAVYDEALGFLKAEEANLAEIADAELQPIRHLAETATPYRGAAVPTAKTAVTKVRGLLGELVQQERSKASEKVGEYRARIESTADFASLDAGKQAQVLARTQTTLQSIAAAKVLTSIRDLMRVYVEQHYPEQLNLACKLATLPPPPPPTIDPPPGGVQGEPPVIPPPPPPPPPRILHLRLNTLKTGYTAPTITSEADLDAYLSALRTAIAAELKKGNRITL